MSQKQIDEYCKHQLSAAEVLAVTDHLGACKACRAQVEAAGNGDAAFFNLRSEVFEDAFQTGAHLTLDQTAAYVDRHLSGEELHAVDDHLTHCEECLLVVNDLRDFRNEIAPSIDREYQPSIATSSVPLPAGSSRRGWFGVSPVPVFAGAVLTILVLSVIAWLVWRRAEDRQPQIANTPVSQPTVPPQPDSTPAPTPTSAVVAQLNEGSRVVTLDQDGKLSGAEDLPPAYQELLKKTLSSSRIEKSSQLQGLSRPSSSLMGSNNSQKIFEVLDPIGSVLLSNQLTFRWSAMDGATGFIVEVYDEKFNPVVASPQLTGLTWTTTLPRGKVYSWQVRAITDSGEVMSPRPPAPQAKFRIVDQAKANELANARRSYPSSHLTLGLLYADAGLLREAEQEFRLMQRANPNSDLARNLLRQVQTLRK
ncbi:MAG TPA: zf-HC2 domain-containing protein [Pyrinomonadaceae bacterium]|nr:zf-HC2 domain-containing protein [Pyrinomonadaceae bacterium]